MPNIKKALLLIDLQNDFCPGGALGVAGGDSLIPMANRLALKYDLVIATQDWHAPQHVSFASRYAGKQSGDQLQLKELVQELWPDHCVQETFGAALHADLQLEHIDKVIRKGVSLEHDCYSAFIDNQGCHSTGLLEYLREHKVGEVYLMGLATDYCVKYTCLDALRYGFKTFVIDDGCLGVELQAGDIEMAKAQMREAGAVFI